MTELYHALVISHDPLGTTTISGEVSLNGGVPLRAERVFDDPKQALEAAAMLLMGWSDNLCGYVEDTPGDVASRRKK